MTTPNRHKYNKAAVDKAIKKDSTIKAREAKLIHRLLKGRKTSDEIYTKADREAGKLRRALEEVAHLTTRMVIPEDGDVRGWEQVCPERVKQIAAVVKTALGE